VIAEPRLNSFGAKDLVGFEVLAARPKVVPCYKTTFGRPDLGQIEKCNCGFLHSRWSVGMTSFVSELDAFQQAVLPDPAEDCR
jgi:hypothetical protein